MHRCRSVAQVKYSLNFVSGDSKNQSRNHLKGYNISKHLEQRVGDKESTVCICVTNSKPADASFVVMIYILSWCDPLAL